MVTQSRVTKGTKNEKKIEPRIMVQRWAIERTSELASIEPRMATQWYEQRSNDEQSWEQMIMFRQNLGWHPDYGVKEGVYPKKT